MSASTPALSPAADASAYAGRAVLVTGGLGFIGSHLVHRLAIAGARVRVLDSLLPLGGGSPRNLDATDRLVEVVVEDTRSRDVVDRTVTGIDHVFHLAGHGGFNALASDWYTEIDTACLGTLNVLESVRVRAPSAHVVFASSLAVYGGSAAGPLAEEARTEPDSLFGVHKLAGEKYCGVYHRRYGVRATVARLATVFGPRQRLRGAANGTLPQALDAALHGEAVGVGGGGEPPWTCSMWTTP
jgi:UDP-glucose 4-epimerase